jgi:hypothetical protein
MEANNAATTASRVIIPKARFPQKEALLAECVYDAHSPREISNIKPEGK